MPKKSHATPAPGAEAPAAANAPAEAPPSKNMDWELNGRKELLFAQIIGVGARAFLTNRANISPGKDGKGGASYDKKAVWLNEIIGPLKDTEDFKDAAWPADHQAVLNFVDRIIKANTHLYTSGQEQDEPAEAGTEGTKDETFTSWQKAIVDVHALIKEAETITEENKKKKAGEASANEAADKEMQDAAARSAYDGAGKRRRRRGGAAGGTPGAGAIDLSSDEDALPSAPSSAKKPKKEAITVRDYATATGQDHEALCEKIAKGVVPGGYTYVDPEAPDFKGDAKFAEPYLEPIARSMGSGGGGGGPSGLRTDVKKYLAAAADAKEKSVDLEKEKEKNRAAEVSRQLALQEAREKMQNKQARQMIKVQKAMMAKMGMALSDDSDDA